jgi:hypothetical protein
VSLKYEKRKEAKYKMKSRESEKESEILSYQPKIVYEKNNESKMYF